MLRRSRKPRYAARLAGIVDAVLAGNKRIATKEMRVGMVVIAATGTRCAIYKGKPVLALDSDRGRRRERDPRDGTCGDVREALRQGSGQAARHAPRRRRPRRRHYLRLKSHDARDTSGAGPLGQAATEGGPGSGSGWSTRRSRGGKPEHPWEDADEFLASAREAARTDPEGLRKAIEKAKAIDPKVAEPAEDLLVLLGLSRGKAAALSKDRAADATEHLVKMGPPEPLDPASGHRSWWGGRSSPGRARARAPSLGEDSYGCVVDSVKVSVWCRFPVLGGSLAPIGCLNRIATGALDTGPSTSPA